MSRGLSLVVLLTLAVGLTVSAPALAQPNQPSFGEGTHYLRAIINNITKFKVQPINQSQLPFNMEIRPGMLLIVVFGQTGSLDQFQAKQLAKFVRNGGALLIASDRETHGNLESDFGLRIAGDFLVVPAGARSAYRDLPDCPIVSDFANPDHPILQGVSGIATNRPGHLVRGRNALPTLAWFPAETQWEDAGKHGFARNVQPRQWAFAAGGTLGQGKVLVLSDHSVLINDMLRQPDNQNLTFAYDCIDWLTNHGQRNMVYFLEDGKAVTNFNITLKEPPPPALPPLPPEEQLIDKGNEILTALDEGDVFNRFINERVRQDGVLRAALMLSTGLLCIWGLWRIMKNRHRFDRNEPVLAACLADHGPLGTLADWRNESLVRQNNCWEVAHQQARQCFASLLEERGGSPPQVVVTGGWWQRWRMKRTVLRLWRLASGRYPERVTAAGLRRIEGELRAVRTALANGTLKLSDSARTA